jgi:hypothetical protein
MLLAILALHRPKGRCTILGFCRLSRRQSRRPLGGARPPLSWGLRLQPKNPAYTVPAAALSRKVVAVGTKSGRPAVRRRRCGSGASRRTVCARTSDAQPTSLCQILTSSMPDPLAGCPEDGKLSGHQVASTVSLRLTANGLCSMLFATLQWRTGI